MDTRCGAPRQCKTSPRFPAGRNVCVSGTIGGRRGMSSRSRTQDPTTAIWLNADVQSLDSDRPPEMVVELAPPVWSIRVRQQPLLVLKLSKQVRAGFRSVSKLFVGFGPTLPTSHWVRYAVLAACPRVIVPAPYFVDRSFHIVAIEQMPPSLSGYQNYRHVSLCLVNRTPPVAGQIGAATGGPLATLARQSPPIP